MVDGSSKRSREDREVRPTEAHPRARGENRPHSSGHHRSRSHGHGPHSSAHDAEAGDTELQTQMEELQTSLHNRFRNIKRREDASAADSRLLQQRFKSVGERERGVLERETAVQQQEHQIHAQSMTLRQLQTELLDQYNAVVASLPRMEDRLQAARQLLPECATAAASSMQDSPSAEAQSSAAPHDSEQQPASPLPQHQASSQPEAVLTAKTSQHNADALLAASVQVPFASSLEQSDRGLRSIPATFNVDMRKPSHMLDTATTYIATAGPSGTAASKHAPSQAPQHQHQNDVIQYLAAKPGYASWDGQALQATSLLASKAQKPAAAACQPTSAADNSSSSLLDASPQKEGLPVTQVSALINPAKPIGSQQQSSAPITTQTSKGRIAVKVNAVQSSSGHSAPESRTRQQAVSKQQSQPDAAAELHAGPSPAVPSVVKSRTGLRSPADAAAHADKAGTPCLFKAQEALKKQSSIAESAKGGLEAASGGSGRGLGRGRSFGRAGRRGRARSHLFRSSVSKPQPAGDLDEAVQALKATTEAGADPTGPADSRTNGANLLEDDELKPSFMRRTASDRSPPSQGRAAQTQGILQSGHVDKEAGSSDLNPRPLTRRRTEPSNAARQAKAKAVLQKEAPDLLDILQQKGLADHIDLLEDCTPSHQDRVYMDMHNILSKLCEGKAGSWQGRNATGKGVVLESEESGKHEYCLLALEHLLERADAYSINTEPVRWGWCRELSSFVFVFPSANRIVVEKPCYGHATYFFDLEEPLPVPSQVQRLIAVLSVPGVSRRKLLEDSSLDPGPDLTTQERKQLEAAGWKPGTTVRSLLNFTGDRIFHQSADIMTGHKQQSLPDYKEKIAKVLSEGASGGRVTKHLQ